MPTRTRAAPLPDDQAARLDAIIALWDARVADHRPASAITCQMTGAATAELLLFGEIGWDVTALGVREALKAAGENTALTVRINSGGGFVFEGFAIYNALARHKGDITVIIESLAASMASLIAMAGNKIIMPTNSFMMVHNPSGLVWGEAGDMREMADLLDKLRSPMIATYAARTGNSEDDVVAMLDATTWLNAEEAKANGFADEVEAPVAATACWDLSQFKNVPAALAAAASATPRAPRAELLLRANTERANPAATQEPTMSGTNQPAGGTPAPGAAVIDPATMVLGPVAATLAELQAIAGRARLDADWIVGQLAAQATAEAARDAAIDAIAARGPPPIAGRPGTLIADERDKKLAMMGNALEHRASPGTVKLDAGAREFRGMTLADIARECLQDAGVKTRGMTKMEIAKAAMSPPGYHSFRGAGVHTTSDFPNLLANTASKRLRAAYEEAPRTFLPWTTRVDLPDFKDFKDIALSGAPALRRIREDGEVTYGTITEGAETWQLIRYGKAIAISYVAIVNDDLGGFTRIPTMFANAATRLESDIVYQILLANAALADTVALFHSTHANLLTGASTSLTADAAGIVNVGKVNAYLAKQTAPGNASPMNLSARYILLPPSLAPNAMALWGDGVNANTAGNVNIYRSAITPITEARLELGVTVDGTTTAGSATAFYLAADPNAIDTIHYGYLEGEAGPTIDEDVDFDTDGVSIKVMHNFGAKAIDYRGLAKSAGA